jgi:hypothetical protein
MNIKTIDGLKISCYLLACFITVIYVFFTAVCFIMEDNIEHGTDEGVQTSSI